MKTINYLLLFCCMPMVLLAGEKTSPEKHVGFKRDAEEPLLHMARSVSSDGPPCEGALRMQKVAVTVSTVTEETPDAADEADELIRPSIFVFTASATGAIKAATPPKPSPRSVRRVLVASPKNKSAQQSPRSSSSRRNSKGSLDDDLEARQTKEDAERRERTLKNATPRTREQLRFLFEKPRPINGGPVDSDSLQTIDGENVHDSHLVDSAGLNTRSRNGSMASGDVAHDEWLPVEHRGDLTPNRLNYLRTLKSAVKQTKKALLPSLRSVARDERQTELLVDQGIRKSLAPIFRAHYRSKSGAGIMPGVDLNPAEDQLFKKDIEESFTVGCCTGCGCPCCSSCVIM